MVTTSRGNWRRRLLGNGAMSVWRAVFVVLTPPAAWTLHLLVTYFLVALACTTGWGGARVAVGLATLPFAALSAWAGVMAFRWWRRHQDAGDGFTAELAGDHDWVRFSLLMGILSAILFTIVIVVEAVPAVMLEPCAARFPV